MNIIATARRWSFLSSPLKLINGVSYGLAMLSGGVKWHNAKDGVHLEILVWGSRTIFSLDVDEEGSILVSVDVGVEPVVLVVKAF